MSIALVLSGVNDTDPGYRPGQRVGRLLENIEVPTLLVWGEEDRRSPMNIAEQFRDAIPKTELAIIAGAGNMSNVEQPEKFNAQVRRFCASNLYT